MFVKVRNKLYYISIINYLNYKLIKIVVGRTYMYNMYF